MQIGRPQKLHSLRSRIGDEVRHLRHEHRWTQSQLAKQLHLSQSRLSEIETGQGSFTAEQFLVILQLFNVPASHFGREPPDRSAETQNALARLGAYDLRRNTTARSGEELGPGEAIREALIDGHPRLVVSAAVVLVRNLERINLRRIQMDLVEVGSPGRLAWLIENTLHAAASYLAEPSVPVAWAHRLRRAEAALSPFLQSLKATVGDWSGPRVPDLLDPSIRTRETTEEVGRDNSAVSNEWRIITRLQVQDFVVALRSAARDD